MQLIKNTNNFKEKNHGCIATIGNYDGLHLGHKQILQELQNRALKLNLASVVIIFEPQPQEYFRHQAAPARLMTLPEKILGLQSLGIDYVLCLRFNQRLAKMSASQFIKEILVAGLNLKYLIVGADFNFGFERQGNADLLKEEGKKYGFNVELVKQFFINKHRVSSTYIRNALEQGDLEKAEELLGRPYSILGRVVPGARRGRDLGFPTANIYLRHQVLPLTGVYIVQVKGLPNSPLNGIANIGFRPTIGDERKLLEVYIFDFSADIYRHKIEIIFLKKIRDEIKFASFAELRQQIIKDAVRGREFFERT
jgi:riboflavin kinase / FMN adenylyltransferase